MSKRKRKGPYVEAHVRLYRHETSCPAWCTLSTDSKALLVELRALYNPTQCGVVYLSAREAMRRLNVGQRRAQAAFAELLERGWITVHERGGFHRKVRHATAYMLQNEPGASPGAVANKAYMRWQSTSANEKTR